MKKLLKNKKGFTLVELLAVIVVLAIIMVIATQQISGVIKKNTVDSFESSLNMVVKQAKLAYTQYGESLKVDNVTEGVDYDTSQYTISLDGNKVCITSVANGKFDKMDKTKFPSGDTWSETNGSTKACKEFKK